MTEAATGTEKTPPPAMSKCAKRRFRRNFFLGIVNGVMFRGSRIFIDEDTIIPIFIMTLAKDLSCANVLVGLAVGLRLSGWYFPQLFVANSLGAKERKNPTYRAWGGVRVACILAIVVSVWLVGAGSPLTLLALFMVFWGMLYVSAGMSGVSFVEVVAKTIPVERLSGFYGYRMFFAGLLSLVCGGLVISRIQAAYVYPNDYALIFFIAFLMISGGIIIWSLASEQRDTVLRPKKPLKAHLRESAGIVKSDAQFRALFCFKVSYFLWAAGIPFFILFAQQHLESVSAYKGQFAMTKVIGLSVSNILWVRIANSERWGGCQGLLSILAALAVLLPAGMTLFDRQLIAGGELPFLFTVFFLVGAVQSGIVVGYMKALIQISPPPRRTLYIGLMNTLLGPMILGLALAGGGIVELASYKTMFIISAAAGLLALVSAGRLKSLRLTGPAR